MVRGLFAFSLGVLACTPALGAPPQTTQVETVGEAAGIDRTSQTEDVRFNSRADDRMTVPVQLSGTGPYQFMVDTGASRTAISRQLAARLNLSASDTATLHSVVGPSTVSTVNVPSLQVTRRVLSIRDAPLLDQVNMGADGILGVDSLRSQRVMFDFAAQTMSIVPSVAPDFREEPGTVVVVGRQRSGRLIVTEATVHGRPLTVVIDTGSELSVGNEALRRRLGRDDILGAAESITLQAVTGDFISGDLLRVREIQVGDVAFNDIAIVFTNAHTFKQLKLDKRPALLLGMNAMRAFKKVSIDFANKKLRVIVPEHSQTDVRFASAR